MEIYEYSRGRSLFYDKVVFISKNVLHNVVCLGKTRRAMDKLNDEAVRRVREEKKEVNIWVHGIFQNYHRFLRGTVKWFGCRDIEMISVGHDFSSPLRSSAMELQRVIEDICERSGADKVNLIGVSYGGVVSRYYMEELGGFARVNKFVSVCSPYGNLNKRNFGYWAGKVAGNMEIDDELFLKNSVLNHYAIHASGDKVIGRQKVRCEGVRRFIVKGGHSPSIADPRKLELIEKILKGKI